MCTLSANTQCLPQPCRKHAMPAPTLAADKPSLLPHPCCKYAALPQHQACLLNQTIHRHTLRFTHKPAF
eukprot:359472-Chlamydomonas_euryale.AAC.2